MILPSRWAMAGLLLGTLLCAMAVLSPPWLLAAIGLDAAVVALVILQGKALKHRAVTLHRTFEHQLQIDRETQMHFTLENQGPRSVHITLWQVWPDAWEGEQGPWQISLQPFERATVSVKVTPRRRGLTQLPATTMDVSAPLSLAVHRRQEHDTPAATVYPNLAAIAAYERLRRSRALRNAGFHRQRMVGAGREFDHLREYVDGDDIRDINWSATARAGKPRTNLYQAERSRDVMLCIDGGRMMGNPVGSRTTLDYAIDAAMLLAHACKDQADRVGLITFREKVETILKPSVTSSKTILQTLACFDARPVFPSYLSLVETLRSRQTHRSLVFVFTDLSDPQLASDLAQLLPMVCARHLVVVVSLRDTLIERVAAGPAKGDEVTKVLAARTIVQEREAHSTQLRKAGVQVLHCDAEKLSIDVINRYMRIKARQML